MVNIPNREEGVKILQNVLDGKISRDEASKWGAEIYLNDEIEITDITLQSVLVGIMGLDTPSTDREYLYCEIDIEEWIDSLRV